MDEEKLAEARRLVMDVARELELAAEAARKAADSGNDQLEGWKQLQQLFTRFDEAGQRLKDLRRTVDEMMHPS
ncbi:MAG: hypothetical protein IT380_14695 [Myxococcales bacterium]|nr:hypothetical protein [Myxococcales bacterium]